MNDATDVLKTEKLAYREKTVWAWAGMLNTCGDGLQFASVTNDDREFVLAQFTSFSHMWDERKLSQK